MATAPIQLLSGDAESVPVDVIAMVVICLPPSDSSPIISQKNLSVLAAFILKLSIAAMSEFLFAVSPVLAPCHIVVSVPVVESLIAPPSDVTVLFVSS